MKLYVVCTLDNDRCDLFGIYDTAEGALLIAAEIRLGINPWTDGKLMNAKVYRYTLNQAGLCVEVLG